MNPLCVTIADAPPLRTSSTIPLISINPETGPIVRPWSKVTASIFSLRYNHNLNKITVR